MNGSVAAGGGLAEEVIRLTRRPSGTAGPAAAPRRAPAPPGPGQPRRGLRGAGGQGEGSGEGGGPGPGFRSCRREVARKPRGARREQPPSPGAVSPGAVGGGRAMLRLLVLLWRVLCCGTGLRLCKGERNPPGSVSCRNSALRCWLLAVSLWEMAKNGVLGSRELVLPSAASLLLLWSEAAGVWCSGVVGHPKLGALLEV